MSENSTENTPTAELPGAIPVTPVTATPEAKETGRYAAYDTRLQRFVGGVHDTKKAAADAAKGRGVASADVKVRQV